MWLMSIVCPLKTQPISEKCTSSCQETSPRVRSQSRVSEGTCWEHSFIAHVSCFMLGVKFCSDCAVRCSFAAFISGEELGGIPSLEQNVLLHPLLPLCHCIGIGVAVGQQDWLDRNAMTYLGMGGQELVCYRKCGKPNFMQSCRLQNRAEIFERCIHCCNHFPGIQDGEEICSLPRETCTWCWC